MTVTNEQIMARLDDIYGLLTKNENKLTGIEIFAKKKTAEKELTWEQSMRKRFPSPADVMRYLWGTPVSALEWKYGPAYTDDGSMLKVGEKFYLYDGNELVYIVKEKAEYTLDDSEQYILKLVDPRIKDGFDVLGFTAKWSALAVTPYFKTLWKFFRMWGPEWQTAFIAGWESNLVQPKGKAEWSTGQFYAGGCPDSKVNGYKSDAELAGEDPAALALLETTIYKVE